MKHLFLAAATLVVAAAQAQPADTTASGPAPTPARRSGVTVRAHGGVASLALGDAAAFHQAIADSYVAAGVPIPTQRSFPAGPSGGIDILLGGRETPSGQRSLFGAGIRYAGATAYSLYGDYAGTLDLVSRVSTVFIESVSIVEFRERERVRPFLGSRGGTVLASSSTEEALDLGSLGASRSRVGGRGVGYSLEGFGGFSASAGPVRVFVQGGYRYARVPRLNGEVQIDGMVVEEGRLPYGLGLSGWTGAIGVSFSSR